MLEGLAAFVVVSAVVICTPGQDTALTIRNTLAGGRRSGIATAAGVAAGQAIWTIAASAGGVALLSASEPVFRALKLAGAAYLVYLGAQSIFAALRGREHGRPIRAGEVQLVPSPALRQGLWHKLGTRMVAFSCRSLLPEFVPAGSASFVALLALGVLFCSLTLAWLTLYALAVARARRLLSGRVRRVLDALTGLVLVLLGARLPPQRR